MARILLAGMVAGNPGQGGATWAVLQYLKGLRQLGHEVLLVEPVRDLRPEVVRYFRGLNLPGATLVLDGAQPDVTAFARRADVLLNMSGMLRDPGLVARIPIRVYIDLDPAFNQFWASQGIDVGLPGHTHFATVGQALGTGDCKVPTAGLEWIPILPPVVLNQWQPSETIKYDALTTIGNWRAYGSIQTDSLFLGQKAHSLRQLIDLPERTNMRFLLALRIHPDERTDLEDLEAHGWELIDAEKASGTPSRYRDFVRGSFAEFGLAKHGYVASQCGWFSDRSACYLAAGRPVIALDTGFGRFLPTGEGLFAVTTGDDVIAAIEALQQDYKRHAQAAQELAREYLDSNRVLAQLLERVDSS